MKEIHRILPSLRYDVFLSRINATTATSSNPQHHPAISFIVSSAAPSLGALAAAALATAASLYATASLTFPIPTSQCEPSLPRWSNKSKDPQHISPDDITKAIHDLWSRADEQLDRFDAAQPHGKALPRIPLPRIIMHSATSCTVIFKIDRSLDYHGAINELRHRLRSTTSSSSQPYFGASTSETSTVGPKGRARRIRRSSSSSVDDVIVDILEPHEENDLIQFEFHGAITDANLSLLESIIHAAARPGQSRHGQRSPYFSNEDDDAFASLFQEGRESLSHILAPWRELLEEFQRMHTDHQPEWGIILGQQPSSYDIQNNDGDDGGGGDDGEGSSNSSYPGWHHNDRPLSPNHPQKRKFLPKRFDPGESSSPTSSADSPVAQNALRKLESMGCQVFLPTTTTTTTTTSSDHTTDDESGVDATKGYPSADHVTTEKKSQHSHDQVSKAITVVDWKGLAGYEAQKRAIEDCLLLPLVRPDVYDSVAKGTRKRYTSNRPRAILFTGPPGTGKTSSARVIASQARVPMVYIPLESIVSKWYGESEKALAAALAAADSLPEGCIVFLDELDALATSRGSGDMHEATRRVLGVLLRHMDGFDSSKKTVIVGATNRPQDLDPALLSRFSSTVEFGLPSESCRAAIAKQYAHQLSEAELCALARATPGMSGRDLRDVCEQAERRWAAKIIRKQVMEGHLPPIEEYLEAANARSQDMGSI